MILFAVFFLFEWIKIGTNQKNKKKKTANPVQNLIIIGH